MFVDSIFWTVDCLAITLNGRYQYSKRFDRSYLSHPKWYSTSQQIFTKKHERQHVAKVPLLTIWFGANDATFEGTLQHVPLLKFKANLKHLIRLVKNSESDYYSPETRIVLISPPPVNSHQGVQNRDFTVTKSYAEAVVEVGKEEDIPVLDAWTVFWDASGHKEQALETFLTDGLHPSGAGYEVINVVISHGVIFWPVLARIQWIDQDYQR